MTLKQPTCPACASTNLRIEDTATGRHQCARCGWRCVVNANGKAREWLKLTKASTRPAKRKRV